MGSELQIYGVIGTWWDDVSAKSVMEALDKCTGDLLVRINSPGGEVWEGFAIYNAIKRYNKGRKCVVVDGLAASAASYIAMAGDEIIMPENTMMMIHDPLSFAFGTSEEMRKEAEILDKIKASIITSYRRCGKSDEDIAAMMEEETWMTAEEAKAQGFCDTIGQPAMIPNSARADRINQVFDRLKPPPKYKNFYASALRVNASTKKDPPAMALSDLLRKAIKDVTGIDPDDSNATQVSAALYAVKKNADDGVKNAQEVTRLQGEVAKHEGEKRATLIAKGLQNKNLTNVMVEDITDEAGAIQERSWANSVSIEALERQVNKDPEVPSPVRTPAPQNGQGAAAPAQPPSAKPRNATLRTNPNAGNLQQIANAFGKTPDAVIEDHANRVAVRTA